MKYTVFLFVIALFVFTSCGKTHSHEHQHEHSAGDSTNEALNEMVMNVHDEVMPKMGDIYNLKKKLVDTIAHTSALKAEKKIEFEGLVAALDSANNAMMDWMHNFDPNRDSTDQEKTRSYLESEIERINKIKEQTNEVIEQAKTALGKK